MLASLSDMLAWKPAAARGAPSGNSSSSGGGGNSYDASFKARVAGSKARRAPMATSEQDGDFSDASETESAESSQSNGYPFLRRQQSAPSSARAPSKWASTAQPEMEPETEPRPALRAVYSFARAGLTSSKLFLVKNRGLQPRSQHQRKPHSRSMDELSESDFLPLTAGTLVSTRFGLGRISAVRAADGVTRVELQTGPTLFVGAADDDLHSVPALAGDRVHTPAGDARVVGYDARQQLYTVRLRAGGGLGEYEQTMRAADVTQPQPQSQSQSPPQSRRASRPRCHSVGSVMDGHSTARPESVVASKEALQKGLSTALQSLVATSSAVSASTYSFVSNKYYHGQPVVTKLGAGHIIALDPQQRRMQVRLVWGATAFLNDDMIDFYPKALAGAEVHTKFGPGVVLALRPADGIYTVRLHEPQPLGHSDVVYVPESDVHRPHRLVTTATNVQKQVRGRLRKLAQRRFAMGERIVVDHHDHDQEPSSAGI